MRIAARGEPLTVQSLADEAGATITSTYRATKKYGLRDMLRDQPTPAMARSDEAERRWRDAIDRLSSRGELVTVQSLADEAGRHWGSAYKAVHEYGLHHMMARATRQAQGC